MSLLLPIIFGIIGLAFSSRTFILQADKLSPIQGLITYYLIILITILALQKAGLVVGGTKFDDFSHAIGAMLVIFSFFIVINWTSCYVNEVTKGQCDSSKISNIYLASEDGAVYYGWSKLFKNRQVARILTFVVTPMVLSGIGIFLLKGRKVSLM